MIRSDPSTLAATGITTRRTWLAGVGAASLGLGLTRRLRAIEDLETWTVPSIRRRFDELGLGPCSEAESERFHAVGDAPKSFLESSVALCEGLAQDYLRHFRLKRFDPVEPPGKLVLVGFKEAGSYAAFLEIEPVAVVPGEYLQVGNAVCFYDKRADPGDPRAAQLMNTLTLCHEATHQLTFNTGLLRRDGDVPLVISEGLAQYGETRRPGGRGSIGDLNVQRFNVLKPLALADQPSLPLRDLLNDDPFDSPDQATVDLAYAQSWLLIYWLLDRPERTSKFRTYLDAIRPRNDPLNRLLDIETHLGDWAQIDQDLARFARRLARG